MMSQLALSSWEVIARRSLLMARNQCSPLEYQRMVLEKVKAAQLSAAALMTVGGRPKLTAVLAPWHRAAARNVKRLRRK
jgi:hypothetical protein